MAKKKGDKQKSGPAKRSPGRGKDLPEWLVEGAPKPKGKPQRHRVDLGNGGNRGNGHPQKPEFLAPASGVHDSRATPPPASPENPNASRTRARELHVVGGDGASPLPAEPLRSPGRPTKRTAELEDRLLDWLSCGGPLRAFCRLPGSPSHVTVHDWRKADKEFAARYLQAKHMGYHELAEQCLEIADTPQIGEIREEGEGGGDGEDGGGSWSKVRHEDMLGHRKLQIWTRLQLLAKWFPKQYGNKLDIDHSGTVTFDEKLRQALGLAPLGDTKEGAGDG